MNEKLFLEKNLDAILRVKNYQTYLEVICDMYLNNLNNKIDFLNFNQQMELTFNLDMTFFEKIFRPELILNAESLQLNKSKYGAILKKLDELKMVYSVKYLNLSNLSRSPFSFVGIDLNLNPSKTSHNLTIIRADNNTFSAEIDTDNMFQTVNILQQSLLMLLNQGIFTISNDNLHNYEIYSKELIQTINMIKEKNSQNIESDEK